jgi:hypothetical protein
MKLNAGQQRRSGLPFPFCPICLAFLLAAPALRAADEADPFAALTAAVNQPAVKYVPPDTTAKVIDTAKLRLSPDALAKTATLLAACVQKNRMHETEKDLPLCSRMIGLALLLDPANAAATNLNRQLIGGKPIPPAEGAVVTRSAVAGLLLKIAQQCRETGSVADRKLALYLLSLAASLDPANKQAVESYALYERSGITADWAFASGAAAAPRAEPAIATVAPAPATTDRPALLPAVNPEYARRNRNFTSTQNTVHSLVVMVNESGLMVGEVMDIIATVSPVPGSGIGAQIAFARPVGREMGISFEEAKRAAQVRYPFWEPARITVSFGDKYSAKDGGSAGGAFALLLLSLLDGLQIDNGFAMTGDVTVDWRIRKVGAVAEKVRGAARANRMLVAVPKENERDVADMTLLYPPDVLLGIQVFGIANLSELIEVARTDRAPELTQAIEQYRAVQQRIQRSSLLALSDAAVQNALAGVLKLAPNHLSAKYLLLYARGRSPTRLSLATSMQQIVACTGPLLVFIAPVAPAEVNMPDDAFKRARQSLAELRNKVDKDAEPLHAALLALVITLDKLHQIQVSNATPSLKKTQLKALEPKLETDRQKVLSILQALQENKEFLERIMGS